MYAKAELSDFIWPYFILQIKHDTDSFLNIIQQVKELHLKHKFSEYKLI